MQKLMMIGVLGLSACVSQPAHHEMVDELTQVCDIHQGRLVWQGRWYCQSDNHKVDAVALKNQLAKIMIQGDTLPKQATKTVGVANPASTYCVEQGGQSHIKTDKDGNQYGECHLSDGRVVDEWEYFRQNSPSP